MCKSFDGPQYFAEGDSITNSYLFPASTNYPQLYAVDAAYNQPFSYFWNNAVPLSTVTGIGGTPSLNARAPVLDATFSRTTGTDVLSVLIGANDFDFGVSTSDFLTQLAAYCDARRLVGWKLVICTILPRTAPGFNAWRNTVNATLVTWVGTHAAALCDFAADPIIGPDAAASNHALYVSFDGTHPTPLTETYMELDIAPVLKALGAQ